MKSALLALLTLVTVIAFAQDQDFHLDKEYAINKNGIIDLSSTDAKVFITGTSRTGTAHVKIDRAVVTKGWFSSRGEFRVDVDADNGNLRIKEHRNNVHIGVVGYYREEYKIQIEAPEGVSLTIRGDDGDYFIKNIDGKISLDFDDGDAQLTDCDGTEFSFRLDDGDVSMDKGKGELTVRGDDADVEILNASFTSINADMDDGDLIVHTSLSNNGDYRINAEDGSIVLNVLGGGGEFIVHHDDARVTSQGNFDTTEDSENYTKMTLPNGTAKVNIRADDASVKLVAKI
jgi:hypothetical protein